MRLGLGGEIVEGAVELESLRLTERNRVPEVVEEIRISICCVSASQSLHQCKMHVGSEPAPKTPTFRVFKNSSISAHLVQESQLLVALTKTVASRWAFAPSMLLLLHAERQFGSHRSPQARIMSDHLNVRVEVSDTTHMYPSILLLT